MSSKLWDTRTKRKTSNLMQIKKNKKILKWKMILKVKCTQNKKSQKMKTKRVNRRKQMKRWVMLMKTKKKKT